MRKIVVYIAMSLDGYIADSDGGVDWLAGDGSDEEHPGSYDEFINTVDTVIMGYKTYNQIVTELSPDEWVYAEKQSYVITHHNCESTEEIHFTDQELSSLIESLKREEGKDIWICGGADIINQLLEHDLVDRFHITVIPMILGGGVSLFNKSGKRSPLKLLSVNSYNGMTDLIYERR